MAKTTLAKTTLLLVKSKHYYFKSNVMQDKCNLVISTCVFTTFKGLRVNKVSCDTGSRADDLSGCSF